MLGVGINEQQDASTWLQLRFLTTFAYSKAKIHLVYNPSFCRASFDTVRQLLAIPPCMRKRGFMQRAYQKISGLLLAGHKVLVVSDSYGGLPAARLAERFSQQHSTSEPPKLPVDNLRFLTFASIAVPKPQRVLGIRMLHLVNLNDIARRCNRLHRPRDMNGRYFIFDRMRSVIWTQLINQHLVHSWLLCGNAEQWREHFSYNKLARRMLRLIKSFALGEPYDNRIDN
jgi:hypothetical protein